MYIHMFFFFSSRRRHTRFDCDWSSDVCSSDLDSQSVLIFGAWCDRQYGFDYAQVRAHGGLAWVPLMPGGGQINRSEERRVGEESRSRWSPYHLKKKIRHECKYDSMAMEILLND